jgi:hypothetical protein
MPTPLRGLLLGALIIALLALAGPLASAQDRDYDLDVFYSELASYGGWSEHPRWGYVWQPRVSDDWRPYSRGYWVYTEEYGWYWEAEEPWGWAVFHYGRWVLDEDDGWIWLPGTEWGPAWVAWRDSDEYVGWAPLGPDARWGPDGELAYDARFYDDPRYAAAWCFVQPHYMTTPGLYRFLAPAPRNLLYLRHTRPVLGYQRTDRRVVNRGFDVRRYERLVGRPVAMVRLRGVDSPREQGLHRAHGGPDIPVFRPRIIDRPDGARHRPPGLVTPDRRAPDHPGRPDFGSNPDRGYSRRAPDQPTQGTPPSAGVPPGYNPQRQPYIQPGPGARGPNPPYGGPPPSIGIAPGYKPPAYNQQGQPGPAPGAKVLAPPPGGGHPPAAPPPSVRPQPPPGAPPKKEERKGPGQPEPR